MKDLGDSFFKNPLGLIGTFLVLVEAIAGLVVANSSLKDVQNTILVLFIVFFPCLVLIAFYCLVTRHHEKLYSPSDYKDEQNFVHTYNRVTQKTENRKMERFYGEIDESSAEAEKSIELIKNALVDVMELQKKIVPNIESPILTEDEKTSFVSSLDDYLYEIEEDGQKLLVEISPMYKSHKLVEQLVQHGYSAKIYRSFIERKEVLANAQHEAIWLGSEIPVKMATEVIKLAKSFYPHLKYIYLNDAEAGAPNVIKYQIFIGGATSTAKELGLKALQLSDFNTIYTIEDQRTLHNFVKSFMP